jgi:hypothetical protein
MYGLGAVNGLNDGEVGTATVSMYGLGGVDAFDGGGGAGRAGLGADTSSLHGMYGLSMYGLGLIDVFDISGGIGSAIGGVGSAGMASNTSSSQSMYGLAFDVGGGVGGVGLGSDAAGGQNPNEWPTEWLGNMQALLRWFYGSLHDQHRTSRVVRWSYDHRRCGLAQSLDMFGTQLDRLCKSDLGS